MSGRLWFFPKGSEAIGVIGDELVYLTPDELVGKTLPVSGGGGQRSASSGGG